MLKPSDFNNAVPQFQNGNYASNPINPKYVEEPSSTDYNRGTEPLQTLPAQWWNWFMNKFTSRFNKVNIYVKNLFNELAQLLSLVNVTPDGTEGAVTDGQLKNAFKELYPDYINTKLALKSTYVKKTQKVNNHALSGDITISKSDVGLGNVANTGDSATPVSGGTTKFTTGGAYTELAKKQDKLTFDSTPTSGSFNPVISEGIYNALSNLGELKIDNTKTDANLCIPSGNNKEALFCMTNGTNLPPEIESWRIVLLRCECIFKTNSFIGYTQTLITNGNSMYIRYSGGNTTSWGSWKKLQSQSITTLAFSTSTSYSVGEYCIYNDTFYRCTVAHSAGAWNASHFTDVTVGGELETKANQTDLALPTDAVLHYSFDEVPDYPDGTADVRLLDNNTFDIQSTDYRFLLNTFSTSANDNGKLKVSTNTNVSNQWFVYMPTQPLNKIVKIRFTITYIDANTNINIRNGYDSIIGVFDTVGTYEIAFVSSSTSQYPSIYFYVNGGLVTLVFDAIYIGNGSYSTPVIDNANGQWNGTNNGSIVVQGVSGKAIKSFKDSYKPIKNTNFKITPPYSFSLWLKFPSELEQGQNIIDGRDGTLGSDEGLVVNQNRSIEVGPAGGSFVTTDANVVPVNIWSNIVVVTTVEGSGNRYKVYVNGSLIKEEVTTVVNQGFKQLTVNGRCVELQHEQSERELDDFLFFDRALSADEVTALYLNKANTPKYYGEVPVTCKINGHTLEEDITLTKADVGLGDVANKDLSNVVNTGDSATPVSGGTTKFTTGGAYTELAKKVDKTTTVNGHALSGNVTVTKADLGLGNVANRDLSNVVNTGDSATPSESGTTKFTTGGAYNLLTSLAPIFSTSTNYAVGDMVTYNGRLYTCTTAHSAGAWNASHFTVADLNTEFQKTANNIAVNFTTGRSYSKGELVIYGKELYRCKNHTYTHVSAWDPSIFEKTNLVNTAQKYPGLYVLNTKANVSTVVKLPELPAGSELIIRMNNESSSNRTVTLKATKKYVLGILGGLTSSVRTLQVNETYAQEVPSGGYLEVRINYLEVDDNSGFINDSLLAFPLPTVNDNYI